LELDNATLQNMQLATLSASHCLRCPLRFSSRNRLIFAWSFWRTSSLFWVKVEAKPFNTAILSSLVARKP
jgi:hypothetical protein